MQTLIETLKSKLPYWHFEPYGNCGAVACYPGDDTLRGVPPFTQAWNELERVAIQIACEAHARGEAKKDLSFASGARIKHLSSEDQTAIVNALEEYAATGAARAIQFAKLNGWIKD